MGMTRPSPSVWSEPWNAVNARQILLVCESRVCHFIFLWRMLMSPQGNIQRKVKHEKKGRYGLKRYLTEAGIHHRAICNLALSVADPGQEKLKHSPRVCMIWALI